MSKGSRKSLKRDIIAEVDSLRQELIKLSLRLHAHPEVGFQEKKAATWLASFLEERGFRVERGICDLATAFRARYGEGHPAIGFLAEYDALPKLGHACGHNLIAASAVGAALAARKGVDIGGGQVVVIGTPAEEVSATKALMAQRGAFDGLDAAMLVHPSHRDTASTLALACIGLEVEFLGRAAHAAAQPQEGINALEALILSFNAVDALRQHIRSSARIHGIITSGGDAANIVPAYAAGSFLVRAEDFAYLELLKKKVLACFQGAAQATGAHLRHRWAEMAYAPMRVNRPLADLFTKNVEALGRAMPPPDTSAPGQGSTDMGNVSQVVPTIHPSLAIAPHEVSLHSEQFAQATASPEGQEGMLLAAKALALTAADLLLHPESLRRVREAFLASG
ncbi:MAG: M20 family metallopeptidase [Chloroflexi bacterium]|nr:M20 family metallopeptidase [Chloroflexota bacterium]